MKQHFGHELIERPRRGSANPSLKIRKVGGLHLNDPDWQEWEYDGPNRIPNGRKMHAWDSIGEKEFSDVLGPLNGYLTGSVGRQWDEVFSELSAGLGAFSWPLRHVLTQHVNVEANTWLGVDGKVYADTKHGPSVVSTVDWRHREFYVHPLTGRLCRATGRARRKTQERDTDRRKLDGDRWLVRISGIWYIGTYRKREPGETVGMTMESAKEARRYVFIHTPRLVGEWPHSEDEVFCKIKQANRKELRVLCGV